MKKRYLLFIATALLLICALFAYVERDYKSVATDFHSELTSSDKVTPEAERLYTELTSDHYEYENTALFEYLIQLYMNKKYGGETEFYENASLKLLNE